MVAQARRQRNLQRKLLHPVPLLVAPPHHGRHLDQRGQGQHPRLRTRFKGTRRAPSTSDRSIMVSRTWIGSAFLSFPTRRAFDVSSAGNRPIALGRFSVQDSLSDIDAQHRPATCVFVWYRVLENRRRQHTRALASPCFAQTMAKKDCEFNARFRAPFTSS